MKKFNTKGAFKGAFCRFNTACYRHAALPIQSLSELNLAPPPLA